MSTLALAVLAAALAGLITGSLAAIVTVEARATGATRRAVLARVWTDPSGVAGPAEAAEAARSAALPAWRRP